MCKTFHYQKQERSKRGLSLSKKVPGQKETDPLACTHRRLKKSNSEPQVPVLHADKFKHTKNNNTKPQSFFPFPVFSHLFCTKIVILYYRYAFFLAF